jgi:hypothetical protein
MRRSILLAVVLLPVISAAMPRAQQPQTLRYAVVFSDSGDVTHFRDEELPWQVSQSTDPRHSNLVTPFLDAEKIGFLRMPVGLSTDWHPAPGKRFVMVLSGVSEIEVGDGERRKFGPGSVLLVTDVFIAWVPVP